jgi:putative ABC transport system ATP-binding protein
MLKLALKTVRPLPIPDKAISADSIWRSEYTEINAPGKYTILASSGKGKSTLIAYLYGLRCDYTGEVIVNGREAGQISLHDWSELRKTKLSVVFQDLRLFPKLNVAENLEAKNRLTNHKTTAQIKDMLEEYGIGDKWTQSCGTLSFGQQQRVAIIRSLLQPFEMLMLDEPFSHLDQVNIEIGCRMIMREAAANGGGYMYTTLGDHYAFDSDQTIVI